MHVLILSTELAVRVLISARMLSFIFLAICCLSCMSRAQGKFSQFDLISCLFAAAAVPVEEALPAQLPKLHSVRIVDCAFWLVRESSIIVVIMSCYQESVFVLLAHAALLEHLHWSVAS